MAKSVACCGRTLGLEGASVGRSVSGPRATRIYPSEQPSLSNLALWEEWVRVKFFKRSSNLPYLSGQIGTPWVVDLDPEEGSAGRQAIVPLGT